MVEFFPTVAKQAHVENIEPTIRMAMRRAKVDWSDLSALAVTVGPGLAPALEIGIETMKQLSVEKNLPLIAVNHIEAHALSALALRNSKTSLADEEKKIELGQKNNLEQKTQLAEINFPVLAVVVSGGHTQFIYFEEIGKYKILGSTIDDAAGECLDKIGRMLNLGYPAGAVIERFAKLGNAKKIKFPLPMTGIKTYDMSFAGLKTFARNYIQKLTEEKSLSKQVIYDFCASIQYAVFRHINYKLSKLIQEVPISEIWLGGGVAQNVYLKQTIRETIKKTPTQNQIKFRSPYTKRLCMDNASMIGLVGYFKFERGDFVKNLDSLDRNPRWQVGTDL
jgi:N6-L-threonylcarbamoyladenine synthase